MNPPCYYDSYLGDYKNWNLIFLDSNCFNECLQKGCQLDNLTISCDPLCDNPECGFGLGACGYCASGCTKEMLLNDKCDPECNTRACMYDNNACGWCAPNCFQEDLYLPYCKYECSVPECSYQRYICNETFCAPGCTPEMQNNQICDQECNVEECNYDNLVCNQICTDEKLQRLDICFPECDQKYYNFQNGVCGDCNSGCYFNKIGDNNCDKECFVKDCGYDKGDCGCALGCRSVFNKEMNAWIWDSDDNGCKTECLVESCLYNHGVCNNQSKIRATWFQQILEKDFNHNLDLSECYNKHPECTEEILWEIDQNQTCVDACNSAECLYCMGLDTSSSCKRSASSQCLICLNSKQVYDYCFHSLTCPPGFKLISELNDAFLGAEICFRDHIQYSLEFPFPIYVSQTGNDKDDGSLSNPVRSLSVALQLCTRKHNIIILTPGRHNFTTSIQVNQLSTNPNSPLEMLVDLFIDSIRILGDDSTIYLVEDNMKFKTRATNLIFLSLTFNATYALSSYCNTSTCMYCPTLFRHGNIFLNDRGEVVYNIKDYPQNCSNFWKTDYISVSSNSYVYLIEINVVNFRQQLRTFIYSEGNVVMNYVSFTNIQNYKNHHFITVECKFNCNSIKFYFNTGEVNNFNNGYEYSDSLVQAGFLKITNINYVEILGINFNYIMVITGNQALSFNSFIEIKDILGKFYLQYCVFNNCLVNKLLNVDTSMLSYEYLTLDEIDNIRKYAASEFDLSINTFQNIISLQCLLCFSIGLVNQIIKLQLTTFENIYINNDAIISISNILEERTLYDDAKVLLINLNGTIRRRWLYPERITFSNLVFQNIFYSEAIISVKNQQNVGFFLVYFKYLKEFNLESINSLILRNFINNPSIYLELPLTLTQLFSSKCNDIIKLTKVSYVIIEKLEILFVDCSSGGSALKLLTSNSLYVNNLTFSNFDGSYDSDLFSLISVSQVKLIDCEFVNMTLRTTSFIRLFETVSLSLENFFGQSLFSLYNPCLSFEKISKLNITSFECKDCGSEFSDGAAINIIPDIVNSEIYITDLHCENCYTRQGYGGAINIQSFSIELLHNLTILNSVFNFCSAVDGASVYLSSKFSVMEGKIANITIKNSRGSKGGVFSDYHALGLINITTAAFENNEGYYSGVKSGCTQKSWMISFTDIVVINSQAQFSIFYFESTFSDVLIILMSVTVKSSTSNFITAKNIRLSIDTFNIDSGKGIILDGAELHGRNMQFFRLNGYAVSSSKSKIDCINLKVLSSTSAALLIENNSMFNITNSVFSNINSEGSSLVLSMTGCPGLNIFESTSFSFSSSTIAPLMSIRESNLTIKSCRMEKNKSLGQTSGISLFSSVLHLYNSTLSNQESNFGGFIYLYSSSLIAYNNSFDKGLSTYGGSIYSTLSSIKVYNCKFTKNSNSLNDGSGGALYGINNSNFTIDSCIFSGNTSPLSGSSIYFSGATIIISNSLFSSQKTSVIISLQNIDSLLFEYSLINGLNTTGISLVSVLSVKITYSVFQNLFGAISAVATKFTNSNIYSIYKCEFHNNSVMDKGAALDLNGVSLIIAESLFINNSAESGGAVNYICPGSYCSFDITNTTFSYNNAYKEGGGIKWADKKPMLTNVSFSNNSALYSNDVASFPAILKFTSARFLAYIECVPGQVCSHLIQLEIQDTSGNRVIQDNTSTAIISASNGSYSISGNSKSVAIMGIFTFNSYKISGKPGTEVNISISTSSIDTSKATQVGDTIDYIDTVFILVKLRDCVLGEQKTSTSCIFCEPNTYTFDPAPSCNKCPEGGNCTGGWKVYPLPGYWKSKTFSDIIYSCHNEEACIGSQSENDFFGGCEKGYSGNKCFGCEIGYKPLGNGKCMECPSTGSNITLIIFVIIIFATQVVILTVTTIRSSYSRKSLYSIYIKILANYFQLISLVTQLDLDWPWFASELFSVQKSIANTSDQILSFDCLLENGDSNYSLLFFKKLVTMSILPLILWGICSIVWILICIKKKNWKYMKRDYFTSMIICFFLVYPSIVKLMFSMFACEYISGSGYWMSDNLQIKCWGLDYVQNKLTIALPSIIVWALGVPTAAFIMLHKNRKRFNDDSIRVIFGFFYKGYKRSVYYWEFLIMYRNILVICIMVFLGQISKSVQALTLVLLLLMALYFQLRFQPYTLIHLNHMESAAVFTAVLTIYCGLYFLSNEIRLEVSIIVFFIIILGNVYFLCYWLLCMFKAFLYLLVDSFYWVRKLIKKSNPYPEYTFERKIIKQGVTEMDGDFVYSFFTKHTKSLKLIHLKKVRTLNNLQERVLTEGLTKIKEKRLS